MKTPSSRRLSFDPWLIPAALLPIIPVVALLRPGIAATSDGLVHLLRTLQVAELMKSGVFYPQWAPDFYFGYGYPFFLFYAPGAHMLAACLALLGLGVVRSLVAVQVASLVLGSTGAYLAARSLFRGLARPAIVSMAALAAAALYDFTPLRMRELFNQGNLSQLLALSILPWCLWALLAVARGAGSAGRGSWAPAAAAVAGAGARTSGAGARPSGAGARPSGAGARPSGAGARPSGAGARTSGAGALLAALLYAHHPAAFLAYPLLGLLALAVALLEGAGHRRRAVGMVAAAFVLGLMLSAPFLVPWVLESSYGSLGRMETGPFNASLNLVPWDQLFAPAAVLDAASINPPRPHTVGLLQAILAALGALAALILSAAILSGARRKLGAVEGRQPAATGSEGILSGTKWSRRAAGTQSKANPRLARTPGAGQQAASFDYAPAGRSAQDAQSRPYAVLLVIAALLVACLALMLPVAAPLWTGLPLAKLIAFPWRLLGPAGLLAALMAATPLLLLPERSARAALVLILLLAPLSVAAYLFPPASLWRPEPAGGLTLADIGRYESSTNGSRGTASANEYLPRWVADPNPPHVLLADYEAGRAPQRLDTPSLPPGSQGETLRSTRLEGVYRLDLAQPGQIVIRSFYYPGWRAWIDGQEAAISPGSPYGLITVAVPAGAHELRVAWGTTWPRTAGWVLFAAGLVGAGWLVAGGARTRLTRRREDARGIKTERTRRREDAKEAPASTWLAVAVIVVVAAVKILWVEPYTGWFRLQSPEGAPRSMTHPLHVRFANGVELLGYDLPQDTVRQGDQLPVRLYWQAHEGLDENLGSFVHLVSPAGAVTWANLTRNQAGDMPARSWPTGFYVVDDFRLGVPGDTPPVAATVVAGLLDEAGRRVPLAGEGDTVTIGQVTVKEGFRLFAALPHSEDAHRLGEHITLRGYSAATEAEGRVRLTLYWQTDAPLDMDYSIFAQAVNEEEMIVSQADGPACEGACPMTSWTPGSTIEDSRVILLPAGTRAGGLHMVVGIYDMATGERLPVRDGRGADRPQGAIRIPVQDGSGL